MAILPADERLAAVEDTMQRFNYQQHGLIEVLITAQEAFGYLSQDVLTHVAGKLHMPLSKVYGVATFYDMFTLEVVGETHCRVCTGPACAAAGAGDVLEAARTLGARSGGQTTVEAVSCLGLCDQAPAALVNHKAQVNITLQDVPAMLRGEASPSRLQVSGDPRILTGPIGTLAPTDLAAHRANGAFTALEKALHTMTPEDVIAVVKDSRLAGRGGAGFPTGSKWEFARRATSEPKYVVCNFDESEPGTFKDRALMEGNPFRVIEGLILSAYATGAHTGYIFIRGEYPEATAVVERALDELHEAHLLGDHILGSAYDFDIEIRHNAGAYICGEETAQFEAIEGKRGHPRSKPPYPTQAGLFGQPTAINNVETLAVVPGLVRHGGAWFRQWGTAESVGLKLFCLSGHVNKPGVVEAPFGLTVRDLIERFGGGFQGEPQAILMGGAAGGFLFPEHLDTPLTHEDLKPLDVPIGSGVIMVFNQSVDLWQVLEGLAHFFVHETCGKCVPCRLGTQQIYRLLGTITGGSGSSAHLDRLETLGRTIKSTCACGLGLTAANPVLTYLHHRA
ncbi:MAG: NAD(P)H-dependent oxidoreductase subunit E [Anaerolineae bacterium]|nr:NAD(P)H-dependent oxidoreductase subunit E [Anaerolineae bacterium]